MLIWLFLLFCNLNEDHKTLAILVHIQYFFVSIFYLFFIFSIFFIETHSHWCKWTKHYIKDYSVYSNCMNLNLNFLGENEKKAPTEVL